jgi:hypothetical protein
VSLSYLSIRAGALIVALKFLGEASPGTGFGEAHVNPFSPQSGGEGPDRFQRSRLSLYGTGLDVRDRGNRPFKGLLAGIGLRAIAQAGRFHFVDALVHDVGVVFGPVEQSGEDSGEDREGNEGLSVRGHPPTARCQSAIT